MTNEVLKYLNQQMIKIGIVELHTERYNFKTKEEVDKWIQGIKQIKDCTAYEDKANRLPDDNDDF